MTNVRVVAAVVDTKQLTLYKQDGKTVCIPQGDPRVRKILDTITPIISHGGVATVNIAEANVYRDFEEQTGGFARFFRVARKKVAGLFGASSDDDEPVEPTQVGVVPGLSTAIDEIIAHATPAANDDQSLKSNETMVAVVGKGKDAKVIPGMEKLRDQFLHACKLGSTKGVENFLKRISSVIDKRRHSIDELLHFMERGDLPIADDGSIIIYKMLYRREGHYVDPHSKKVTQKVGSFVCMDPKLVDDSRRKECSTGLHVARRGYLSGFHGDVCVLAKVAPEDVIAVPMNEPDKMRVCGYHIIFELDQDAFQKLKNNRPMTDNPKAQRLLGRAISGDHVGRLEEVRITEPYGGGLIITQLNSKGEPLPRTKGEPRKAVALDEVNVAPSVDPKAVAKKVTETKAQAPAKKPVGGRQKHAQELLEGVVGHNSNTEQRRHHAVALIDFKKKSKVSWSSLGISDDQVQIVIKTAEAAAPVVPKPAPRPAKKQAPTVKAPAKKAKPAPKRMDVETKPGSAVEPHPMSKGTGVKVRLFELEKVYSHKDGDPAHRAAAALEMVSIRRRAKKSWQALGYPLLTDQLLNDDAVRFSAKEILKAEKPKSAPKKAAAKKAAPSKAATAPAPMTGGPSQQAARKLFNERKWGPLQDFKKAKKKSWSALGFTSKEEAEIKLHIGG